MILYFHIFIAVCDVCDKHFMTFAKYKDGGIKLARNMGWIINTQYNTARCPEHKYKSRFNRIKDKLNE